MSETFCCMICRLLQNRSPACIECGAATMVSLESGSDALKYRNLKVDASPKTGKEKLASVAGTAALLAGYAGIAIGATLWWPAIPLIVGAGGAGIGFTAWRARDVQLAEVALLKVATGASEGEIEKRGIARKLSDTTKSLVDGSPLLAEELIVRKKRGTDVLLRRTNAVPFLVDVDGERIVVAGTLRITSSMKRQTLKKSDPIVPALGVPSHLTVAGTLDFAQIRDGDRVRITGTLSVEMVPELAFHRDAGEANVMRGAPNAVVAIACEEGPS